jgi:hypothetical protein
MHGGVIINVSVDKDLKKGGCVLIERALQIFVVSYTQSEPKAPVHQSEVGYKLE